MPSQFPESSTPRPADHERSVDVCCETFERWLFREGRASRSGDVLPRSFQQHVDQCDDCRAEHEATFGVMSVASAELRILREESQDENAAEFLTRRIMAEVRAEPAPVARAHARARWRAAAAVFIAAVTTVAVMSLWGPRGLDPLGGVDSTGGIASREEQPAENVEAAGAAQPSTAAPPAAAENWSGMMEPLEVPLIADFIPVVESGETTFSL